MKRLINKIKSIVSEPVKVPDSAELAISNGRLLVAEGSIIKGLSIQFRDEKGQAKMMIGSNSAVQGYFVFESNTGTISVGNRSFIGGGMFICIDGIEIGDDVLISWGCTLLDNNSHAVKASERQHDVQIYIDNVTKNPNARIKDWSNVSKAPIIIKNKAWIGFNCILMKGIVIGEGAIIAAGSVVTTSVPDYAVFGGNPAKLIRMLGDDER